MLNYIKSENYRFVRSKLFYGVSITCLLLICFVAFILRFNFQSNNKFPYATSQFYYSNIVSATVLIIFIGYMFSLILTGKELSLVPQSISMGITRQQIFWSKLLVSSFFFILIGLILFLIAVFLGQTVIPNHTKESLHGFIISFFNMLPIVMSGMVVSHVLNILGTKEVVGVSVLALIYWFIGNIVMLLSNQFSIFKWLYSYSPSGILDINMRNFLAKKVVFMPECWGVGLLISLIALIFGLSIFSKKDM